MTIETTPLAHQAKEYNTAPEAVEDAFRIRIKDTWKRLRAEPWYFWFFCAYIMFEYVRPQVIYPWLDFLPWGMVTLLAAFFLRAAAQEPKGISSPVAIPFLAFFIWAAATIPLAYFPDWSMRRYAALINWPLVLILFSWVVNTKFRFFIVLLLFLLCSFKMSQHAAYGWVMRGFSFSRWGAAGASGFFQNAADLGVQLIIFAPLGAVFYFSLRRYWGRGWRLFFLLFPLTAIGGAISTGQRNTMVGVAALGIAVILLFKHRFRNLLLVAMAGAVIWFAMPQEFRDRFDTAGDDKTSQSRLHYWEMGIEIWKDHPVKGIGYENWIPYFLAFHRGESGLSWKAAEVAHSTPISLLAELGTVGFVLYYWLAAAVFFTNNRSSRMLAHLDPPLWRLVPVGLNLGLFGFLAASLFLSVQYYPFLFFQAGFTAAIYRIAKKEQTLLTQASRTPAIGLRPFVRREAAVEAH